MNRGHEARTLCGARRRSTLRQYRRCRRAHSFVSSSSATSAARPMRARGSRSRFMDDRQGSIASPGRLVAPAFPGSAVRFVCRRRSLAGARPGDPEPLVGPGRPGNDPHRSLAAPDDARLPALQRRARGEYRAARRPAAPAADAGRRPVGQPFLPDLLHPVGLVVDADSGTIPTRCRTSWSGWHWSPRCRSPAPRRRGRRTPTATWR